MQLLSKIFDFFYPNICLCCNEKIEKDFRYFCKRCFNDFTFEKINSVNCISIFEPSDACQSFLKELKAQKMLSLPKIVSAFFAVRFCKTVWDMPDMIMSLNEKDYLKDTAKELGRFLNRPVNKKISKKSIMYDD